MTHKAALPAGSSPFSHTGAENQPSAANIRFSSEAMMNEVLELLRTRRSVAPHLLGGPGPTPDELDAPSHRRGAGARSWPPDALALHRPGGRGPAPHRRDHRRRLPGRRSGRGRGQGRPRARPSGPRPARRCRRVAGAAAREDPGMGADLVGRGRVHDARHRRQRGGLRAHPGSRNGTPSTGASSTRSASRPTRASPASSISAGRRSRRRSGRVRSWPTSFRGSEHDARLL